MRKLKSTLIVFLFLVFQNCEYTENSSKKETPNSILLEVHEWYNEASRFPSPKSERHLASPEVLWEKAEVHRHSKGRFIVNVPMLNPGAKTLSFYRLIAFRDEDGVKGMIVETTPERAYLKKNEKGKRNDAFSGQVNLISRIGKKFKTLKFVDGAEIDIHKKEVSTFRTAFDEDEEEEGIWLEEVVIEGESWEGDELYIWFDDPWGDFNPYDEGWAWEEESWLYEDHGGDGDMDVGLPASVIDVSYYLSSTTPGQDVKNPYDGMTAVDKNGVVYTYNASLNAWLMPDVQVLVDNGYPIQTSVTNANGGILSTITVIALAEPTPVGEIIVGAIYIGIFVYAIYEVTTTHNDYEICQILYEQCLEENEGYGQCYDCRDECNSNEGAWPFYKCHWGN